MSIGDALAAARREAGLTITQVSQRTCIRETIVRGIERGDFSGCGGDFYARGHIRSIARAVGLDPDELVREYDATQAAPQQITAADVFQPFTPVKLKERRRPNWSLVLVAALIVVLGVAGFKYFGSRGGSGPHHSDTATQSDHHKPKTTTSPAAHTTTAPKHVQITLIALTGKYTWAEVTSSTGRLIFQGDVGAPYGPQQMSWTEPQTVTVRLGNPGGARLYLNGKQQTITAINPITLACTLYICQ